MNFFLIPLFAFSSKNSLTWGVKIVHEWNGHQEIFSLPQDIENSRQFLLLQTDIFTENSRWVPLAYLIFSA